MNHRGSIAAGVIAACSNGGVASTAPTTRTVKVVATTTVFADIVRNIGGDRVTVTSIIPPGVGPEDYEPKPDDAGSARIC